MNSLTDIRDFSDIWELALEGSGTGVWDRNIIADEIRYSATWFSILGYSYETPKNHIEESYIRVHPDDLAYVQAAMQAHFDGQTALYEVEHRIRCRDGRYKWVLSRGKVIERTVDGRARRMVGTTTDITAIHSLAEQLKLQNETLRENAATLASLSGELTERTKELEAAQRIAKIASWHWNPKTQSTHLSRELWEIIGLPPSETSLTYDQVRRLYHPDDYDRILSFNYTALRSKAPATLEYRIVRPDGTVRNVLTHVEPILQPDGRVSQLRGTTQDVTVYRQIEAALRDSEDHYRHMVELHPQIPWTTGPDGGLLEIGPKWFRVTGMTREETLPFGWIKAVHPDDGPRVMALWQKCLASGQHVDVEYRIKLPDGRIGWFRARAAPRINHLGQIVRWYGTLEDVTDRYTAEEARRASEALAFRVLESTSDGVIVFDRTGRAKYANTKFTKLVSAESPLIDRAIDDIFEAEPASLLAQAIKRGPEPGEHLQFTVFCPAAKIWLEMNIYEDTENVSVFLRDVSDKKRTEEYLNYTARHDFLTGALNRGEFFTRLGNHLAQQAPNRYIALFCLDLDNFKDINDAHGHPTGDKLLQMIVERLNALLDESDLLARTGGDEFMLARTGIIEHAEAVDLAERILSAMGAGFVVNELVVATTVSIGVAISTPNIQDIEAVYKQADIALYQAKANATGNFCLFHPDMQVKFDKAHRLRLDLKKALENEEFFLEFQPIVRTSNCSIVGAEALLRWRNPAHGLVSPEKFIPIAEENGLIRDIGSWVLHQACSAAQRWPSDIKVSVNVSPRQFELGDILHTVSNALHISGLAPDRLKLEITESVFIAKESTNLHIMNELQNLGVNLVLDDFGTGYSSLSYIDRFRFDFVKIDKSFIAKAENSEQVHAILDAIIGITSALNVPVTAEGVETQEQFDRIKRLGCQYAQGYLFGRPGTESEFLRCLQKTAMLCLNEK